MLVSMDGQTATEKSSLRDIIMGCIKITCLGNSSVIDFKGNTFNFLSKYKQDFSH